MAEETAFGNESCFFDFNRIIVHYPLFGNTRFVYTDEKKGRANR